MDALIVRTRSNHAHRISQTIEREVEAEIEQDKKWLFSLRKAFRESKFCVARKKASRNLSTRPRESARMREVFSSIQAGPSLRLRRLLTLTEPTREAHTVSDTAQRTPTFQIASANSSTPIHASRLSASDTSPSPRTLPSAIDTTDSPASVPPRITNQGTTQIHSSTSPSNPVFTVPNYTTRSTAPTNSSPNSVGHPIAPRQSSLVDTRHRPSSTRAQPSTSQPPHPDDARSGRAGILTRGSEFSYFDIPITRSRTRTPRSRAGEQAELLGPPLAETAIDGTQEGRTSDVESFVGIGSPISEGRSLDGDEIRGIGPEMLPRSGIGLEGREMAFAVVEVGEGDEGRERVGERGLGVWHRRNRGWHRVEDEGDECCGTGRWWRMFGKGRREVERKR